jgi:putative addiction module killer protein
MPERVAKILITDDDKAPFEKWYADLRDIQARVAVRARINRAQGGNFGDHKFFRGIGEMRIDVGPGYRIYFALHQDTLIILLGGGDKKSQESDIENAVALWEANQDETERFQRDFLG